MATGEIIFLIQVNRYMARTCDDCGETFETLTRLRLHDCGDTQSPTSVGTSHDGSTDEPTTSVAELDDLLEQATADDVTALYGAVTAFESVLSSALTDDTSGDTYRDTFWSYHERVSDTLYEATRSGGWEILHELLETFDPAVDDRLPLVTPTIANAVGRNVIHTRLSSGVEAIPEPALVYLDSVAVNAAEADDFAREEVHAYGWGIGHPDHSVVERLQARVSDDIFTVNPVLEHAFYADQYAAVDALERLVRDESIDGTLSRITRENMPYRRYLLGCVYGLKTDDHWPGMPRYFDWDDEFDGTFELDEPVERRIRDLVVETGFDADLPDDWTFQDLGI